MTVDGRPEQKSVPGKKKVSGSKVKKIRKVFVFNPEQKVGLLLLSSKSNQRKRKEKKLLMNFKFGGNFAFLRENLAFFSFGS